MQTIILKALEKGPDDRQQSMQELRLELETAISAAGGAQASITREHSFPGRLEIAHVVHIDLVGCSILPIEEQRLRLRELHKVVENTTEYVRTHSSDQVISLPGGEGLALVFFGDPEAPVRCAVELTHAINARSDIKLRMGIHSGPVYRTLDSKGGKSVEGSTVSVAQHLMDSGDSGHILLSQAMVDVLNQLGHWSTAFHNVGESVGKDGVRIHVFNFYSDGVGNPKLPTKLKIARVPRKQSVAGGKRLTPAHRESGSSHREKGSAKALVTTPIPQKSVRTSAPRVAVPQLRRWVWLVSISCVLLIAASLSISAVRNSLFHFLSASKSTPAGIPSLDEGKHVIVLPFDVQGDRETLGFIAEGLDEELSRKLSSLPILHVVSASVAEEQAKPKKIDLRGPADTIARNFGINLIVHGTVQEGGGYTRINVDFDDVADTRVLLTKHFDYPTAAINLLELDQQIYESILRELHLRPKAEERRRAANPTNSSDAYYHYLQGRYASRDSMKSEEAARTAIGFFQKAIQEDPGFALAYVRLSDACRAMYSSTKDRSWFDRSLEAVHKAENLNDDLPEVHLIHGDVYQQVGQYKEAIAEYEKAKKLSPSSDVPWSRLGQTYEKAGQPDDAIDAYMKATQQNPYSLVNRIDLGAAYFGFNHYEKALAQFRIVTDLDPGNYLAYWDTGAVHLAQGKWQEAIHDLETALAHHDASDANDANIHTNLGTAYFYMKRYSDSVKEMEKAVSIRPNDFTLVGNLADAYRWAKRKNALKTYEKAIDLASEQIKVNPRDADALGSLALYYAKSGNLMQAENFIRQARSIDASRSDLIYDEATIRMIAKQNEEALKALRLALEKGFPPTLVTPDPEFGSLSNNAEFKRLLENH
jgi:tetratricopeptide (TPR) repeat protein/class 3 adenylate cyclase